MISVFRSAAEKRLSVQQLIDGQEMLVLVLVVVLQFEGTGGELHLYHRAGENVVLPCNSPSSFSSCSEVKWFYKRDKNSHQEVWNGTDDHRSPRDSKFSVDSSCSLIINNIDPHHAGIYVCISGSRFSSSDFVYLNVLSIYQDPQNVFPPKDEFILFCSLTRYGLNLCSEKSFHWLDDEGTELTEGVFDESIGPRICISSLTVKRQSDKNRNFTCQFGKGNRAKVEFYIRPSLEDGPPRFEGITGEPVHLYHRAGDEAVLPCNRPSSSDSCSSVDWIYQGYENMKYQQEVHRGIIQSSPRSARMSLDRNCSLIINNINADDGGYYRCQPEDGGKFDTHVFLSLLIISSSPPAVDPTQNEDVTLICSLLKHRWSHTCPPKGFLWLNETGSELTGEGDGYKSGGQFGCVSFLTVNLQSSRRFTCQFVEGNKVKIEAHYQHEGPPASSPLSFIMLTLKITGLILMVGITVGIIRTRGCKKPQKDIKVRFAADDDTVSFENDGERSAAAALH